MAALAGTVLYPELASLTAHLPCSVKVFPKLMDFLIRPCLDNDSTRQVSLISKVGLPELAMDLYCNK